MASLFILLVSLIIPTQSNRNQNVFNDPTINSIKIETKTALFYPYQLLANLRTILHVRTHENKHVSTRLHNENDERIQNQHVLKDGCKRHENTRIREYNEELLRVETED